MSPPIRVIPARERESIAPIHPSASKRPRAHTNDDAGRKASSKRLRPSTTTPEPSEADSRESDDRSGSDLDGDDGDDAEDENAYFQATQAVAKHFRPTEARNNTAADFGIIEEVRCTNFMCHQQLTVTLGPLINFIIGHNGSGKSAVLTALTLCLGGKATATNRGQNLKSFIKEGRDHCNLSVKLKNQGPSAYKPDVYGASIIVERHFNRAGSSGFKLKDRNGKMVSTKKAELEDIIDAFALQLDNPMNVLTQDNARQFLNDSNPKDKYKFFLKGTQLENLRGEYDLLKQNTNTQLAKSETLKADVADLKGKYREAVRKYKQASKMEENRQKQTLLTDQMVWARVEEEEQDLERIENEITMVNKKIEQRTADADSQSERYATAHQALSEANQMKEDRQAELAPEQEHYEEAKAKFQETRSSLSKLLATERVIVQTIQAKQRAIERYEAQIAEQRERQAEADNGQHAQKMQELKDAKEECERAKATCISHNDSLPVLNQELKTAQDKKQPVNNRLQEQRQAEQRSKTTIRSLEQGQRNWIDSFPNPRNLDKLLQLITQNERRFSTPPIGPMGRYIKLLKPEWGSILEKQSGPAMNAFIVTSKADQQVLANLMKNAGCYQAHPIYIGRTAITSKLQEPADELDTWLRVLKFDDVRVRDQMIINQSIDQCVLISDRAKATQFMQQHASSRKNVKICFTMADGETRKGFSIHVNPNSNAMAINPILEFTGNGRMQADKDKKLQEERRNLGRIQQEMEATDAQVKELQKDVDRFTRSLRDHETRKRQLNVRYQQSQQAVENLEQELSAATPDAGLIESFQEGLEEVKAEKEFQEAQFEDITIQKDKLNEEARIHKDQVEKATQAIATLKNNLDRAQAKIDKLSEKREAALRNKNRALAEVDAAQANKAEWEEKQRAQLVVVQENTEAANSISSPRGRVEVPRGENWETLTRKIEALKASITSSEKELGGTEVQLMDRALEAKRRHKAKLDDLNSTEKLLQAFLRALKMRDDRWHRFKKDIARRARVTFTYLLSERQFRGDLAINHHEKQLDIHVQPDITVASGSGRQTKTLSGGEKSFSTICLLLALWDAMGSPIRCLDEFDVFMDSVNRDISMKMMIQAARRAVGRQYILITPQAMNSVEHMHDVKIHRMTDPERGQTTLNVGG